jgi:hypothetical protein
MAKDCDQPKNPDRALCRNCEKTGHFSRDCPEPKDWSKVKCNNCQEMGHTIKVGFVSSFHEVSQANPNSAASSPSPRTVEMLVVAGATMPLVATLLLPVVVMLLGVMVAALPVVAAGKRSPLLRNARLRSGRMMKNVQQYAPGS